MKKQIVCGRRLFLALLLSLCLLLAAAVPAAAAGIVALGSDELLAGVARAGDGETITMTGNITNVEETMVIPAGKNVVIDMNGFHIRDKQTYHPNPTPPPATIWIDLLMEDLPLLRIEKGATLTLTSSNNSGDPSEIINYCKRGFAVENNGTLILNNVSLSSNARESTALLNNGTVIMNNGTLQSKGMYSATLINNGTFTLNGGLIQQTEGDNGFAVKNSGKLEINDGSVTGTGNGITTIANSGTVVMKEGYLLASGDGVCTINNTGSFTKSGGTIFATGASSLTIVGNALLENSGVQVDPVEVEIVNATVTTAKVLIDGKEVAFDAYNVAGNNYFKLRDLAFAMSGTAKQFEVSWDAASKSVLMESGKAYTPVGGEMAAKGSGNAVGTRSSHNIYLNGKYVDLKAYNIGGNNYFKLRDLGSAMDFGIAWDGSLNQISIDTGAHYVAD